METEDKQGINEDTDEDMLKKYTIMQIRAAGGKAYVVTYPAEVTQLLKEEG